MPLCLSDWTLEFEKNYGLRYGGGRNRSRKRAGQQVQQVRTLQAAVHVMRDLAHLLTLKGVVKAAGGVRQQIDTTDL